MTLLGMFLDLVQNITETWFYKSNFKLFEVIKEFKHNNQEFKLTRITGQIFFLNIKDVHVSINKRKKYIKLNLERKKTNKQCPLR